MMTAYQQTAALKAAIELGLFTAVAEGQRTPAELAAKCGATERGMRMLADYLTVHGLLEKQPQGYRLTPDSEVFLNHHSPAYMGGMIGFLGAPGIRRQFDALTEAVRRGGVATDESGATAEVYGGWVDFAQSMEAMMVPRPSRSPPSTITGPWPCWMWPRRTACSAFPSPGPIPPRTSRLSIGPTSWRLPRPTPRDGAWPIAYR